MEFEDVLAKVGDYGKYQKKLLIVFLIPSAILLPWFSLNNFFFVSLPDHWCRVPELEKFNLTVEQEQRLVRPINDSKCSMYDVNYTSLLSSSENWTIPETTSTKACQNGWNYDKTNYDFTASSQWNMVCENGHYSSLVLTMANVGSIIGTPIYGSLSDRIGRRLTFFVVVTFTAISAIASILVTNLTAFIILRTINGTLMPTIFQLPFIILLELVGPDKRTRMNGISNSSWTVGMCIMPLLAWLSRDWVTFGLLTSSSIVLLYLYWPMLPESPRWLLSRGKYAETTKILSKIAKANEKDIEPADIYNYVQKLGERIKKEKNFEDKPSSLWKYPELRKKFLIITYCWVADITAYYGLQINGYNLAGNEFLNFFLLAAAELPGYACSWIFMERVGRRWCSVSGLTLTGLACFVAALFPQAGVWSSFVAKFGASVSFMAVYQQGSELYPTSVRGLGMGLSATCAGAATIAIPFMVYLNIYGPYIPFVIMGAFAITAAMAAVFLPETLNKNLPQTIDDAEKFGLNFSCCSGNRQPPSSRQVEMSPSLMNGTTDGGNAYS